ncbi:hypothetical protein DFS34DRAFT_602632 [Phlyctochytrium arcticum]|nr:hypothetical protein DFS34DRAFT_602632 [Phlyctochytrium arcticum]
MSFFILPTNSQKRREVKQPESPGSENTIRQPLPPFSFSPTGSGQSSKDNGNSAKKLQYAGDYQSPSPLKQFVVRTPTSHTTPKTNTSNGTWTSPGFKVPEEPPSTTGSDKNGRKKAYKPGGSAERLKYLLQRDKSDSTMWMHMSKRQGEHETSPSCRMYIHKAWRDNVSKVQWTFSTILPPNESFTSYLQNSNNNLVGFRHCTELHGFIPHYNWALKEGDLVDVYDHIQRPEVKYDVSTESLSASAPILCMRYKVVDPAQPG